MPVSAPPTDPAVLTAFRAGDRTALERVFRDQFPALLEEAKAELGDDASASRVVVNVFAQVCRDRGSFENPSDLDTFLRETVHSAAVRQKSRRAMLHHHSAEHAGASARKTASGPASADECWTHVVSTLHLDGAAVDEDTAAHTKHEIAEHIAGVAKPRSLVVPIAVGVVVAAVIGGGLLYLNRGSDEAKIRNALGSPDAHLMASRPGVLGNVTLNDGTGVKLGPESNLRIVEAFGELRAVGLEGTASFTVAKGPAVPFVVRAKNVWVRATGTAFALRAYPADSDVTVRVKEGQVQVSAGGDPRALAAGQAVTVTSKGEMRTPTPAEADEALGWDDGYVVFNGRPLREVLKQMPRWYALTFDLKDSTAADNPVTMKARMESAKEAIAAIESSTGLEFAYEGQVRVFRPASAKPAPTAKPAGKKKTGK